MISATEKIYIFIDNDYYDDNYLNEYYYTLNNYTFILWFMLL